MRRLNNGAGGLKTAENQEKNQKAYQNTFFQFLFEKWGFFVLGTFKERENWEGTAPFILGLWPKRKG